MPKSGFDIEVTTTLPGAFLSDREGNTQDISDMARNWFAMSGKTAAQAAELVAAHQSLFDHEVCFLFGKTGATAQECEMGIWIEFELSDEFMPDGFALEPDLDEQKEWRQGFEIFAPAMLHVARGLKDLQAGAEPHMQCQYWSDAPNGGAIGVFIPQACIQHSEAVFNLLFVNGLPFPPSSHARIEALSHLNFIRADEGFPACLLPVSSALAA